MPAKFYKQRYHSQGTGETTVPRTKFKPVGKFFLVRKFTFKNTKSGAESSTISSVGNIQLSITELELLAPPPYFLATTPLMTYAGTMSQ